MFNIEQHFWDIFAKKLQDYQHDNSMKTIDSHMTLHFELWQLKHSAKWNVYNELRETNYAKFLSQVKMLMSVVTREGKENIYGNILNVKTFFCTWI